MVRHRFYSLDLATGTVAAAGNLVPFYPAVDPPRYYLRQVTLFLVGLVRRFDHAFRPYIMLIHRVKLNPQLAPPVQIRRTTAEKIQSLGSDPWPDC